MAVKLIVSSSIYNPALLPSEEEEFSQYGKEDIKALTQYYELKLQCPMLVKPYFRPLLDKDDLMGGRVAGVHKSIEARSSISQQHKNDSIATYTGSQDSHGVSWSLHQVSRNI